MDNQNSKQQRWGSNTRHDDRQSGRDRILDAAMHCYNEQGVAATTIDDIAGHAHISRRTVYRYFPNKQAVIEAVVELQALAFFDQLEQAVKRYQKDFPDFLKRALLYTIEHGPQAPGHQLLMGNESNAAIASQSYIDSGVIRHRWADVLRQPFATAITSGALHRDTDFEQLVAWSQRLAMSYIMFPIDKAAVARDINTYVVGALEYARQN